MPLAAIAGIAAAGSIAGGAIAAHGASSAANTQASAADRAAQLQYQSGREALDFQKQVFGTQQSELAPWYGAGVSGLVNLANLLGLDVPGNYYQPGQGMVQGTLPAGQAATAARTTNLASLRGNRMALPYEGGGSLRDPFGTGGGKVLTKDAGTNQLPTKMTAAFGTGSPLSALINPSLGAKGSLLQPFGEQWQQPNALTEQNDPGFKARLQLGQDALERSAAARGGLLTGGTARDLNQFAQDYASNEYGNVYNRALTNYTTRYNAFKQNQADIFNRLAAISGVGQTAAGQLSNAGTNAAGNIGNILMNSAYQQGNALQNAGTARASGYINSANAINGTIGGLIPLLGLLRGAQPDPATTAAAY